MRNSNFQYKYSKENPNLDELFVISTIHRIVRAIAVAPTSALASNFWLNFFISLNNSITFYAIAFKLHTLVQCHKVTLYNKFYNSDTNIYEIIAPF